MSPFYLVSLLSLTAALLVTALQGASLAGLVPAVGALDWLRVHFITIGTVTMFLFGTAPRLLAHRLKGRLPSRGMTWLQFALLNLGYFVLLVSIPAGAGWLASVGAGLVFVAVLLLLLSLLGVARSAAGGDRPAVRFYLTAPLWLLTGIAMAVSLLLNWPAPGGRFGILEAHVHANVWGFLAFVVAATLLDLLPRLVRTELAHPRWVEATYWTMLAGEVGLVSGPWLGWRVYTVLSLFIYVVGAALLLTNLLTTLRRSRVGFPAAAGHLLFGYLWMVTPVFFGPFVLLRPDLVPAGRIEAAAVQGLVLGWVLQMAMGGIASVWRGVWPGLVHSPDDGRGRFGRGWWGVVLVNLGNLLIWVFYLAAPGPWSPAGLATGYALVVLGVLPFLIRLWIIQAQRFEPAP